MAVKWQGTVSGRESRLWPMLLVIFSLSMVGMVSSSATVPDTRWGAAAPIPVGPMPLDRSADDLRVVMSADGGTALATWGRPQEENRRVVMGSLGTVSGSTVRWAEPQQISSATGDCAEAVPALSSDGRHATVVWDRHPPSLSANSTLQIRSATLAGGQFRWGPVESFGRTPSRLSLALSRDGSRATLVWVEVVTDEDEDIVRSVTASISDRETDLGTIRALAPVGERITETDIAASRTGDRATVLWVRSDPRNNYVLHTRSVRIRGTKQSWGERHALTSPGEEPVSSVATSADGTTVLASWVEGRGITTARVATAHVNDDGARWQQPQSLGAPQLGFVASSSVSAALSADGSLGSVLWTRYEGWEKRVATSRSGVVSGPTAVMRLGPTTTVSSADRWAESVHLSSSTGHLLAVWIDGPSPFATTPGVGKRVVSRTAVLDGTSASWLPIAEVAPASGSDTKRLRLQSSGNGGRVLVDWRRSAGGTAAATLTAVGTVPVDTTLDVAARAVDRALRVGRANRLVRSVRTDGTTVKVRTRCTLKGVTLSRADSRRVCGFSVRARSTSASVSARPACARKVRARVTIVAHADGAATARWQREWRVGGDSACRLQATG